MPKICYVPRTFRGSSMEIIQRADTICRQYAAQGFRLSLRQLYYQFVQQNWLPNKQSEYKRLGSIVGDARLAGLLDWNWLEDRGREFEELNHWSDPQEILDAVGSQYRVDMWTNQPYRPLVLIEKDALSGVFEPVCQRHDVPLLACKGYTSLSAMWQLGYQRIKPWLDDGQTPLILHFGDHDPSGLDMTRDIAERVALFAESFVRVDRLALNMEQIAQYRPPPNPAKETDARFIGYTKLYGSESWELDALNPTILAELVDRAIMNIRDDEIWERDHAAAEYDRGLLTTLARDWDRFKETIYDDRRDP